MTTQIDVEVLDRQELTPREIQIGALLAAGLTDKAIANRLAISLKTAENHFDHIYTKLGIRAHAVNSRCAALSAMIARGMLRVSVKALCVWLMVGAVNINDQAARVGRVRLSGSQTMRVRNKES